MQPVSLTRRALARSARVLTGAYPFLSGCGSIAQLPVLAGLLRGETEPQVVRLRSGERIVVLPNDFVGRAVYFFGDLDPKVSWIVRRLLRPGDTAVDIGANFGLVALAMAGRVGPGGAVHAFEPQPPLAALLARSAGLNGFDQLHVHRFALGEADSTLSFFIPDANSGAASMTRREGPGHTIDVPVRRTGSFLSELGLGPIRLMKIDVEGYEETVLAGAAEYLSGNPPGAILFECNDQTVPFAEAGVVRLLASLGYRFVEIRKAMVRMQLSPIDMSEPAARYSHDILAVHTGAAAADILPSILKG